MVKSINYQQTANRWRDLICCSRTRKTLLHAFMVHQVYK